MGASLQLDMWDDEPAHNWPEREREKRADYPNGKAVAAHRNWTWQPDHLHGHLGLDWVWYSGLVTPIESLLTV